MITPRLLTKGDRVAVVAPAGSLPPSGIVKAIEILNSWGLDVVTGKNVYGKHGYFSGTDDERLTDLQNALDDPTIAAILFARGGYGITRILDKISLERLNQSPKWIIGFSDITALHLRLDCEGFLSVHGDMGTTLGSNENSTEALRALLFEGSSILSSSMPVHQGLAEGVMVGGNLSLIIDSLGTPYEIDTRNRILFIEEIGEKTYRVDRMFHQLRRAGKLDQLAGLAIGHFTDITDGTSPFGTTWRQCLQDVIMPITYPVAFGFSIGHEPDNYPVIHGAYYKMEVKESAASLKLSSTRK